ncbi:mfs transporter : Putative 3-phenylpropionic acid transporter OS=Legionella massiliensis GN=BN1094_03825 PE=4 SV=1: MFS_1 [Gemmata massiliana]|uniref:Major facilitator superfamily (MFS) profile domain-containing protein n=1 Tax=Gemmata massiliana TaxID=1210884 RepID=A0A6P2D7V8_9BACT|nr:MFS transporter [Gemmata massiliana]VTR97063.1 mfs transporter : Putative 3-phenylpropionic acid transporter OS=Legionella massiliensis GN=BN1094_03825 PE=4 SV=1: MFS_1 [Gemmata massiliana]
MSTVVAPHPTAPRIAARDRIGLNAANFFLAELTGVVIPFLAKMLADRGWRDDAIQYTAAACGLGVFLAQTPAGLITDRSRNRRLLLAGASLVVGACFGLLPLAPDTGWLIGLLAFLGGVGQAFFVPLLGALALGLAGHAALHKVMGENQGWNHAGNIVAAFTAMGVAAWLGLPAVFYTVSVVSAFAAASAFLIRPADPKGEPGAATEAGPGLWALFRDRRVVGLFAAVALFHLANAPVMPLVGQYIARLGGSDTQVAAVVLVAQAVMIPVAVLAGWACHRWGRKPVFAVAFVALPVRILLYSFSSDPWELVALQVFDGIGAGVYGVVIAVLCADLTRGAGGFNALQGVLATALAVGGVLGPLLAGPLVQHLGFGSAFRAFALVAAAGAVVFLAFVPETRPDACAELPR